ncbi:thioredoxin [Actinotalea sp. M2MS4P-6]|uniref:thioredoxin n=1 Tax=Actinotalea sp. M2MS4P-6 TaxID=2983762 RepID=UPI0021E3D7A6|nr:thioredoxin [Actinotalea sp. M2MS4P-6]MCV2393084.1 thioredoxin [Actinotalea sp. M2MS4P-6]
MAGQVSACPACGTKNRVPVAAKGTPRCASCKAALPWVVPASDENLDAALDTRQLVLLDLWATWCAPCRAVAPVLVRLATRYAGQVKVVKVDVDHSPRTAARFDARSIPTLVLLREGKVVRRVVGAQPEPVLAREVDRALAGSR